jgi:hypothetical protein
MEMFLGIITILLGVVGYFLRQIHADFIAFRSGMATIKTALAVKDERDKSINERIENHERRIQEVEKLKRGIVQ